MVGAKSTEHNNNDNGQRYGTKTRSGQGLTAVEIASSGEFNFGVEGNEDAHLLDAGRVPVGWFSEEPKRMRSAGRQRALA